MQRERDHQRGAPKTWMNARALSSTHHGCKTVTSNSSVSVLCWFSLPANTLECISVKTWPDLITLLYWCLIKFTRRIMTNLIFRHLLFESAPTRTYILMNTHSNADYTGPNRIAVHAPWMFIIYLQYHRWASTRNYVPAINKRRSIDYGTTRWYPVNF